MNCTICSYKSGPVIRQNYISKSKGVLNVNNLIAKRSFDIMIKFNDHFDDQIQGIGYYSFSSERLENNGFRSIWDTINVVNCNCDNDESVNSQTVWINVYDYTL